MSYSIWDHKELDMMEWLTLSPPYFCPLINFVLQQQLKALQWLPVTLKRKSEILTKACQTIHDPQLDASLAISHIFLLLGHYIPSPSTGRRGYIVCREFFFNLFVFDNFLMWTIFSLYWIFYNVASVLCFVFFGWEVCGILAPWPGIEPMPPVLVGKVSTTGPPGKSW